MVLCVLWRWGDRLGGGSVNGTPLTSGNSNTQEMSWLLVRVIRDAGSGLRRGEKVIGGKKQWEYMTVFKEWNL